MLDSPVLAFSPSASSSYRYQGTCKLSMRSTLRTLSVVVPAHLVTLAAPVCTACKHRLFPATPEQHQVLPHTPRAGYYPCWPLRLRLHSADGLGSPLGRQPSLTIPVPIVYCHKSAPLSATVVATPATCHSHRTVGHPSWFDSTFDVEYVPWNYMDSIHVSRSSVSRLVFDSPLNSCSFHIWLFLLPLSVLDFLARYSIILMSGCMFMSDPLERTDLTSLCVCA